MKRFEGPTITNLKLFYKILQKKKSVWEVKSIDQNNPN